MERRGAARQLAAPGRGRPCFSDITMDLREHAERDGKDIVLAREAHGVYQLENTETVPADSISPDGEFPKFGDYAQVTKLTRYGEETELAWLEAPHGLAVALKQNGLIEMGATFWVRNVAKDTEGAWSFDLEPGLPPAPDEEPDGANTALGTDERP